MMTEILTKEGGQNRCPPKKGQHYKKNIKAHNTPLKQFKFPTIKNLVVYILFILIIKLFINDFDLKTRSEMFVNYE